MTSKEITAEILIDAIKKSNHFASKAASILGISRATFYNKLKQFPSAQVVWDEIKEKRHDFVESKLMELIDAGNVTAIIFYLKTQCKDRGYIERTELAGVKDEPIVVKGFDYAHAIANIAPRSMGDSIPPGED